MIVSPDVLCSLDWPKRGVWLQDEEKASASPSASLVRGLGKMAVKVKVKKVSV